MCVCVYHTTNGVRVTFDEVWCDVLQTALKKLTHLDLFGCPVVEEVDGYRSVVFELLPSLKYLDGTDREDQEDEDSEEEEPGLEYLTKELDVSRGDGRRGGCEQRGRA